MRLTKHHAWLYAGLIALAAQPGASASSVQFDFNANSGQTANWSGHHSDNSRISFHGYHSPGSDNADLALPKQNRGSGKGHKNNDGGLQAKTSTGRRFEFDNDGGKHRRDRFSWSHNGDVRFDDYLFGADHSTPHIKHHAELHDVQVTPTPEPQSVVPVPAAFWLLGSGLIALIGAARRR